MKNQKNLLQYRFFKGEKECPFRNEGLAFWWTWERGHYDSKTDISFEDYIKSWFRKIWGTFASPKLSESEFVQNRWKVYLAGDLMP